MIILNEVIDRGTLMKFAADGFGDMVKAVVDAQKGLIAIDDEDFVEFDSLINIRPRQNNRSRDVEDESLKRTIIEIVGNGCQMSENFIHKTLSNGNWGEMSICEQLANIGSEVGRAIKWKRKGKEDNALKAFERSLDLLDLSIRNVSQQKSEKKK